MTPLDRQSALFVRLAHGYCAFPLGEVIETMRPLPVEPFTGMPHFLRGLSVIRGEPIPVVDLGALAFLPSEASAVPRGGGLLHPESELAASRFITLRIGTRIVALAVVAIIGIGELETSRLHEMPPLLQQASADVVEAIGTLDAELLVVLRSARIVSEEVWRAVASQREPS